jgi:hypothetical protein
MAETYLLLLDYKAEKSDKVHISHFIKCHSDDDVRTNAAELLAFRPTVEDALDGLVEQLMRRGWCEIVGVDYHYRLLHVKLAIVGESATLTTTNGMEITGIKHQWQ